MTSPGTVVLEQTRAILIQGLEQKTRSGMTLELLDHDPIRVEETDVVCTGIKGRKLVNKIGILEGLQLVGQTSLPEAVLRHSPALHSYTIDRGVYDGAYGIRIHSQVNRIVDILSADPTSRRAVLNVYDSRLDLRQSRDIPCTVALQFLIRDTQLYLIATMRSSDAFLGLPYDIVQFQMLQHAVADTLGVDAGPLSIHAGSSHLYQKDVGQAKRMVADWETDHRAFLGQWWSGEPAEQARRILLDELDFDGATEFELWCNHTIWS